jgi:hypothetical protein
MTTTFPDSGEGPTFRFTSLTQPIRTDIVELSANFNLAGAAFIDANTLDLSALGATTDLLGRWNTLANSGIDLVGWHHIAVTGRDIYVKIITRGWLFPLGNEAVLIQIVERVVVPDPVHGELYAIAYAGLKQYVRVIEPSKLYPAPGQPFGTNDWPFQQITITTSTSPQLDATLTELTEVTKGTATGPSWSIAKTPSKAQAVDAQALILTYGGGQPVLWSTIATDLAGNELHLQIPLVFINGQDTATGYLDEFNEANTTKWVNAYNNRLAAASRTIAGNGQVMRFAPEAGGPAGGTTHPVVSLTLGASRPSADPYASVAPPHPASEATLVSNTQPAFYPTLASSSVRLKAADALSGSSNGFSDSSGQGVSIEFYPGYVTGGLPESGPPTVPLNGVYARLSDAVNNPAGPLLSFPSNLVGGLGTPNMLMAGLSTITGAVGGALSDLENFANSAGLSQSPAQLQQRVLGYFKSLLSGGSLLPQLFGSLKLTDILGSFASDLVGGIPNLTTNTDEDGTVTVMYQLTANLTDFPSSDSIFVPNGDAGTFSLTATAVISASKPPTYNVVGSITPFTIYLVNNGDLEFIEIPFNSFGFTSKSGSKTQVDVSVGNVAFAGALSFVNTLEQFLQDLGGTGLSIDVTPTEVDASFSISLPAIGVGVLTLSGIAFSSGVKIPFLGDPAIVTFGFASQDNPFIITVCMFGGGGFLQLGLGFHGVQTVQASFEFAGQFALDLGVASGGITLAAGIYYSYAASGPNAGTTLTGFVKLTGEVEVLGIISVSAELDLTLTYVSTISPAGYYVQGTATLKVSISICFFSITVPITVTKQFAGGGSTSTMSAVTSGADETDALLLSDPVTQILFAQVVPSQSVWETYCDAFAN